MSLTTEQKQKLIVRINNNAANISAKILINGALLCDLKFCCHTEGVSWNKFVAKHLNIAPTTDKRWRKAFNNPAEYIAKGRNLHRLDNLKDNDKETFNEIVNLYQSRLNLDINVIIEEIRKKRDELIIEEQRKAEKVKEIVFIQQRDEKSEQFDTPKQCAIIHDKVSEKAQQCEIGENAKESKSESIELGGITFDLEPVNKFDDVWYETGIGAKWIEFVIDLKKIFKGASEQVLEERCIEFCDELRNL